MHVELQLANDYQFKADGAPIPVYYLDEPEAQPLPHPQLEQLARRTSVSPFVGSLIAPETAPVHPGQGALDLTPGNMQGNLL